MASKAVIKHTTTVRNVKMLSLAEQCVGAATPAGTFVLGRHARRWHEVQMNNSNKRIYGRRQLMRSAFAALDVSGLMEISLGNYREQDTNTDFARSFTYRGLIAAAYADEFALSCFHIDWANGGTLEPFDADCANFVNNALYKGGLQMNPRWYSRWNILNGNVNGKWWDHSTSWTVAKDLYDYLLGSGIAQLVGIRPSTCKDARNGLCPGDLLFYDWGDQDKYGRSKGISHVALQTTWDTCTDLVDAHTNDRRRVYWTLPFDKNLIPTSKIHLLHIINNTARPEDR